MGNDFIRQQYLLSVIITNNQVTPEIRILGSFVCFFRVIPTILDFLKFNPFKKDFQKNNYLYIYKYFRNYDN